ncbi:hypothetical protein [Paraburkholderia fungorum]|uniref:hypothetical protein n=1 Tax=Paraburkholderia fungorum TaxID=134537 RepID=UPI0038B9E768
MTNDNVAEIGPSSGATGTFSPGNTWLGGHKASNRTGLNAGGGPVLALAPYLLITITGDTRWSLDKDRLHAYLKVIVGSKDVQEGKLSDWNQFAQNNHLIVAGYTLTEPTVWYRGTKRWVTATWNSEWDVHLHFGFVNLPGKHTHLELLADTNNWLKHLSNKAKHWWRFYRGKPALAGEAVLAGLNTGIAIRQRLSFKDYILTRGKSTTIGVAAPVTLAMVKAALLKSGLATMIAFYAAGAVAIVSATLFILYLQHVFATSPYSWGVAQFAD